MHSHQKLRQAAMALACLAYLLFVAYGSLVPFEFKAVSLDQAWEFFSGRSLRPGGETTRTDWVANVALGVPIGFLIAQSLGRRRMSWLPALAALLLGAAFSAAVEFAQAFFPSRTPSLNDLLAQVIGSSIGIALAAACSNWINRFFHALGDNSRLLPVFLLDIYLAAYLAFALFPYDIMLSGNELTAKMHGTAWGWLIIAERLNSPFFSLIKFLSEIVLTIPLGLYAGYRAGDRPSGVRRAIAFGGALGLLIEIAQFFIFSGISEGLSVITRSAGAGIGAILWRRRHEGSWTLFAGWVRRHSPWLCLAYLAVLLQANGWITTQWSGPGAAVAKLAELRFIPFYYHYFTTEAKALFSVIVVCLAYAPIGIALWAYGKRSCHAALGASLAAVVIEGGKLFLPGRHPDPSNVILAAAAAWAACVLVDSLSKARPNSAPAAVDAVSDPAAVATPHRGSDWTTYALLAAALGFSGYWAITFPTQPAALVLLLAGAAAAVWLRPILFVPLVLAALPALDLAQWSGRLFLDEFDLLLLTTLAVGHARVPRMESGKRRADPVFVLAGGLLAASLLIGCARGLLPWQPIDANSFISYYSPFNALRIAKGALWAWLCYGLLRRMCHAGMDVHRPLVLGMLAGLALTVAVILWERVTFSGLFNFSSDYRVTGPFSQMHVGGAYIECYLAVAAPFLILFILETRGWLAKAAGFALLPATTYALMVTFSRNGYVAFGVGVCAVLFCAVFHTGRRVRGILAAIGLAGAVVAAALPIFAGEFSQKRLSAAVEDFALRRAHWNDALGIRAPDWPTRLLGVGLGRFPESRYLFSGEGKRSGSYQLRTEARNTYLRLIPGESIFLGQRVAVAPGHRYLLKFDARADRPGATITVPICEKWLLSSYGCLWVERKTGDPAAGWQHFEVPLVSDQMMKANHWYTQRPVKLALHNGNAGVAVDIDNVGLETAEGNDLIANGDFSGSLDHWLFTVDNHKPWHVDNLFVHMLFETGWFGLLALGAFSLIAVWRAAASAFRGSMDAACLLAAFTAFIVMGLFNSPIDSPRFLFLYLLLGALCAKFSPEDTHR
jgi:VanZ family protein